MSSYRHGRHEHGQNHLTDPAILARITELVALSGGPLIEIGPGRGALTQGLQRHGRSVTAIEIDARRVRQLTATLPDTIRVVHADILDWPIPDGTDVIVGNIPFHLTTAILRHLLHAPGWNRAVLLVQWEVARRRAGVGGASMMTAQWWPWYEFALAGRVPRTAFTPMPSVDGGLLTIERRREPRIARTDQQAFRGFVHAVFTGRGRGLPAILTPLVPSSRRPALRAWLAGQRLDSRSLPKDIQSSGWPQLYRLAHPAGRRRRGQ